MSEHRSAESDARHYAHDDDRCRQDSIDADGFHEAARQFARLATVLGLPETGLTVAEIADTAIRRLDPREGVVSPGPTNASAGRSTPPPAPSPGTSRHADGSECLWGDQRWYQMHPLYPLRTCDKMHTPGPCICPPDQWLGWCSVDHANPIEHDARRHVISPASTADGDA